MITITRYQCEICRREYSVEDNAKECESKGIFDESAYPEGLMFKYSDKSMFIIFALVGVKAAIDSIDKAHIGECNYLAFRSNVDDSTFENRLCGHEYLNSKDVEKWRGWVGRQISESDTKTPEFKRCIEYLESKGLPLNYVGDGGEIIKYTGQ